MAVTGDPQPAIPRLEVRDARVRFGPTDALVGVDLAVAAGEVVAVLGPSGSGKSTLLRAVAGLQALDAGHVLVDGQPLDGVPPHRRGVGLMFQQHALFPHRDVAGNVGFGPTVAGAPPAEVARRVSDLLELVDLRGYERRRVGTLSGGEQQRVALARALATSPRLLLLDEPLASLDRPLAERLVGDLRQLFTRLSLTVVAVTHDHHEALRLADRLAVMDEGRVLQVGAPARLWASPASRRVAEVLGLPNLVDVDVRGGVARAPWGAVPVEGPDGPATLHLPPQGLALDPAGPVTGTVVDSHFRGDGHLLAVAVGDGVVLQLTGAVDVPPRGTSVRIRLGPSPVVIPRR